jgi:hypothetical protein
MITDVVMPGLWGFGNFGRSQQKTQLSGTLAESIRSGGQTIPSVLLGCRQIYADFFEVVQMGANHLAAYDFSAILGR